VKSRERLTQGRPDRIGVNDGRRGDVERKRDGVYRRDSRGATELTERWRRSRKREFGYDVEFHTLRRRHKAARTGDDGDKNEKG